MPKHKLDKRKGLGMEGVTIMSKVTFDYSKAKTFIADHEMVSMKKIAEAAKAELLGREGAGNDFLGWIDLPVNYDKEEFADQTGCGKDPE